MTIYFLSARTAALKADGIYLGLIDGFEKFLECDPAARHFIEIVPDGEFLPASFILGGEFMKSPPDFADVYTGDGEAIIYIKSFEARGGGLEVIAQRRISPDGGLFTLFSEGGRIYLSFDGGQAQLYELGEKFAAATLKEDDIGGHPVMIAEGDGYICIFSGEGRLVFRNAAISYETGEKLKTVTAFATAAGCRAECVFCYDGEEMRLESSATQETRETGDDIMHFAFFESILTRADCTKYLCDELKESADKLRGFLGEFVDVVIPHSRFYLRHGDVRAAGLVYPLSRNRFAIKYYAVELEGGKICNIFECD